MTYRCSRVVDQEAVELEILDLVCKVTAPHLLCTGARHPLDKLPGGLIPTLLRYFYCMAFLIHTFYFLALLIILKVSTLIACKCFATDCLVLSPEVYLSCRDDPNVWFLARHFVFVLPIHLVGACSLQLHTILVSHNEYFGNCYWVILLFWPVCCSRIAPPLPWSPPSAGRMASCFFTPSHSGPASWRSQDSRGSSTKPNRAWVGEPEGWGRECDCWKESQSLGCFLMEPRRNPEVSGVQSQKSWLDEAQEVFPHIQKICADEL